MEGIYNVADKGAPDGVVPGSVVIDPRGTRYVALQGGKLLGGHKLPLERLHPNIILSLLIFHEEEKKGNYPPVTGAVTEEG